MKTNYVLPFSPLWWKATLIVLAILGIALMILSYIPKKKRETLCRYFGITLLFDLLFFEAILFYMGSWSVKWALPLQYCAIMEIVCAIVFLTRWQWAYEVLLFLGAIGPIQALIFPAFPYSGDYFFYNFYFSHTVPIFAPLFFTLVEQMRPRKGSWWKIVFAFSALCLVILWINQSIGANYMFLMQKPPIDHPLLKYGKWPYYIIIWFFFILIWAGTINTLFFFHRKICNAFRKKNII